MEGLELVIRLSIADGVAHDFGMEYAGRDAATK